MYILCLLHILIKKEGKPKSSNEKLRSIENGFYTKPDKCFLSYKMSSFKLIRPYSSRDSLIFRDYLPLCLLIKANLILHRRFAICE